MSRLNDPMQNIARGMTVMFIGVIASVTLNFLLRMALIRYITPDQYGLYSLSVTIVGVFSTVAILGMDEGAARHIAFFTGKSENSRVDSIISASLKISLASGLICAVLLFLFSDIIATAFFHSPDLVGPLRIASVSLPLIVLIQIIISIMRGQHEPKAKAYFKDTLRPLIFLILLVGVIMLKLPFEDIILAYVVSMALALGALVIYSSRLLPVRQTIRSPTDGSIVRDLLRFSMPLLSVNLLMIFMSQVTALLLGFYADPATVGKYDLTIMAASLIALVINAIGYIFTPTVSHLYGKGAYEDLKQIYVVSTKWTYLLTMPILFVLLLFTNPVLRLLYGPQYMDIILVVQIVSLGYFVDSVTGPKYHMLIATGKIRSIIESFVINAVSNVILCLLLIPVFGILGAGIAAASSITIANLQLSIRLYQQMGIHPLTRNYIVSIMTSVILLAAFYVAMNYSPVAISIFIMPVCLAIFVIVYAGILLWLKAIDIEDIKVLSVMEDKIGLKVTPLITRYIH